MGIACRKQENRVKTLGRPGLITMHYFEAGHMMYLHQPSFDKLLADVRAFIESGKK